MRKQHIIAYFSGKFQVLEVAVVSNRKLNKELLQEEIARHFIGRILQECSRYYKILRPKPKEEAVKEKLQTANKEKRLIDIYKKKGIAQNNLRRWFLGRTRLLYRQYYIYIFPKNGIRRLVGLVMPKKRR